MSRLAETTESGDRQASLEHLRQVLAAAIDEGPPPRDLAALARRLESVLAELEDFTESEDHDFIDDLRARRAEKLAGAKAAGS